VENLLRDLEFGARLLWRRPAFTAVAALSLALGIGLSTVMFSVVNAGLLARVLSSLLYGVSAVDPLAYLGAVALLLAVALAANWLPARRAARVDPMVALRSE
jgi:putative ABC transport system permease protein